MVGFDELHGLRNGVAKLEAEMEELKRTLHLTQATSPGSHAISKITAEIQRCEAIRKGMLHGLSLQEFELWRSLQNRFMELTREEQGRADVITKGETLRRMDNVLRASCSYEKHPEVWVNRENPVQRHFCLLDTPPHGVWDYDDGVSENFLERVRLCVAEAGRALPDYPKGADPEDFWLHRLYLDLLKNNSDSLFCASKEGGMIVSVCVASATFCARLERQALEQSEPDEPARKPAIDIDYAMASWKRMHEFQGEPADHRGNADNKIPGENVELIEHEVWVNFSNEARLPRSVELEWESVLSSKKIPNEDTDLALTLALTREYVKAIGQATGKVADLLVTAAVSHQIEITQRFRETLWRECLDFASHLAQWDAFATWAERVAPVRWEEPRKADGRIDKDKVQGLLAKRRQFFEQRIRMYAREWLSVADRSIDLRLAASGAHESHAQKSAKSREGVESKSTTFTHSPDYRSVAVRGKTYGLTSRQAQMIQILHEAYENETPDVGIDNILESLETPNGRWQDTFKSNSNARKALVTSGSRKGTLRLNL
jgi:hypothetical protein